MAISHIKSNTVADFTGTVTVMNSVGATATANATDLVRPSDWNSVHNQFLTLTGNTAGASTISGTNIVFSGGNNITLSGNGISLVISGPNTVAQTNQTVASGNIAGVGTTFAGTNVSGSMTLNSAGLNLALSAGAGGGGGGGTNTLGASNLGNTVGTSGVINGSNLQLILAGGNNVTLSQSINGSSATITISGANTVAQTNQTAASGNIAGAGFTSATTAGTALVGTHNSAGLNVGVPAWLTTARASTDAIGLNSALTANGLSVTANSSGLSINVPAWLTTAAQSNHSHNFATTTTNGSVAVVATTNSAGATVAMPSWITTYVAQTTQTQPAGNIAGVGTTFAGTNVSGSMTLNSNGLNLALSAGAGGGGGDGVNILQAGTVGTTGTTFSASTGTVFLNGSNNITISQNASNQIVVSGPTLTQYITTARASTDAIGLNSALTANGLSVTANSSGLSINVPAWITTYVAQTTQTQAAGNIAGVGTTFAGTGIAGSMTLNSAGLNLALSRSAATESFFATGANTVAGTNTTGTISNDQYIFSGAGILSVGISSNTIVLSVPAGGGAGDGGNTLAVAGSTAGSNSLVLFSNSPTVTFGMAGNTITASAAGGGVTLPGYEVFQLNNATTFSTLGQNSIYFQKFQPIENVSFNYIERRMSGSSASSSIAVTNAFTFNYGLYSRGSGASTSIYNQIASSQMVIQASYSSNLSAGYTVSQGAASLTSSSAGTVILGDLTGFKHIYMPLTSTITGGGQYAVAMWMSSASTGGTGALRIAFKEMSNINNLTIGKVYATAVLATNASFVGDFAQGVYSATSANLPATLGVSGLTNAVSQNRMYIQFEA